MDLQKIADAYLKYCETKAEEDRWVWGKVWDIVNGDPQTAWPLICMLIAGATSDRLLADVAAGPLEDLLNKHGPAVITAVEKECTNNPRLRLALSGVWGINPGNPIFERWYALMWKYGFAEGRKNPL
jgi:hypothetical protein